ncbi:hypothetical protein EJ04DRAFT_510135, partial [Polyplosphaeria fusca]
MAIVRDPAFWKRFSVAVHNDDADRAARSQRPTLKHSDSWLESQLKKKKQRTWMCWAFWLVFAILVAGVVVTILLLKSKGI